MAIGYSQVTVLMTTVTTRVVWGVLGFCDLSQNIWNLPVRSGAADPHSAVMVTRENATGPRNVVFVPGKVSHNRP